jgi:hypothetical protein
MGPASPRPPPRLPAIRRQALAVLALALVGGAPMPSAQAQSDGIDGGWQQIESTGGPCPTCRIFISPTLTVSANNGWTAAVISVRGDPATAAGVGRWDPGLGDAIAGKPFKIDFILKDQRLHMSMLVDMKNGSKRTIRAVYGRIWAGV